MSTILGVDCSYHSTGLAILKDGKLLTKIKIVSKKEEGVCKFLNRIRRAFHQMMDNYKIDWVVMEELNFSSNFKTSKALLRVHGVIMELTWDKLQKEVEWYHNATWRSRLKIKAPKHEKIKTLIKDRKTGKMKEGLRKKISKIEVDGKKIPLDIKWITVQKINELFDLDLKYEDNDLADAVGIAYVCHQELMELENGKLT